MEKRKMETQNLKYYQKKSLEKFAQEHMSGLKIPKFLEIQCDESEVTQFYYQ